MAARSTSRSLALGPRFISSTSVSPAFVRIGYKAAPLVDLVLTASPTNSTVVALDSKKPIEAQILPEPFTADLATKVELSLTFFHILAEAFPIGDRASKIQSAFLSVHSLSQLRCRRRWKRTSIRSTKGRPRSRT